MEYCALTRAADVIIGILTHGGICLVEVVLVGGLDVFDDCCAGGNGVVLPSVCFGQSATG